MRIGIIGAGNIGQAAATRLVTAGHEVMLSNSRGPETIASVEQSLGQGATAGTVEEAAGYGDAVLVAVPLHAIDTLPADGLTGRVVMDANNYYPERDGQVPEIDNGELGSSELLARRLPEARVVKVFNTMRADDLAHRSYPAGAAERLALPFAGDDEDAKAVVAGLVDDMGFDAVDAGSLKDGRHQQPGTPVYGMAADADSVRAALNESKAA